MQETHQLARSEHFKHAGESGQERGGKKLFHPRDLSMGILWVSSVILSFSASERAMFLSSPFSSYITTRSFNSCVTSNVFFFRSLLEQIKWPPYPLILPTSASPDANTVSLIASC